MARNQPPPKAPPLEDPIAVPSPSYADAFAAQAMGSLLAAQVAVMRLLKSLEVHVGSFEQLIVDGGSYGPTLAMKINNVTFDMPDAESEIQPFNACIFERAPQTFDQDHRPYNRGEPWKGYAIRCLSKTTCSLGLVAWFGHKNERRAFRTAITRALLGEPDSDRGGRVIIVEEYFGALVRLNLDDAANADDEGSPQQARWILQMSITATVDELMAIGLPPPVRVAFKLDVGTNTDTSP